MKYDRPRQVLTFAVMVQPGLLENSMGKLSQEHDSAYGQLISVIIVLQLRGSRLCESNLRIGPYHLVDKRP